MFSRTDYTTKSVARQGLVTFFLHHLFIAQSAILGLPKGSNAQIHHAKDAARYVIAMLRDQESIEIDLFDYFNLPKQDLSAMMAIVDKPFQNNGKNFAKYLAKHITTLVLSYDGETAIRQIQDSILTNFSANNIRKEVLPIAKIIQNQIKRCETII